MEYVWNRQYDTYQPYSQLAIEDPPELPSATRSKQKDPIHIPKIVFAEPIFQQNQMAMLPITNVCFIGAGRVGALSATAMANFASDHTYDVVDIDYNRIAAWNSASLPVEELGLRPVLEMRRDGRHPSSKPNLRFSNLVRIAILNANMIFIAVDTPLRSGNHGIEEALDTSHIMTCVETIASVATRSKIVVLKSTVPCGTAEIVMNMLRIRAKPGVCFTVLSNPEFLAEGTAWQNVVHPDRVVIGSAQGANDILAAEALRNIFLKWVPSKCIRLMSNKSAELTKLASNALLAQRISSINAISAICEDAGADVGDVAGACGFDKRLGNHMLQASLGFGGPCLKKDILALARYSASIGLPEIGSYWRSINNINELQRSRFIRRILKGMAGTLRDKKLAVLGCAFKKGSSDVRESSAVSLIKGLLLEGARIAVYDGKVRPTAVITALADHPEWDFLTSLEMTHNLEFHNSLHVACEGAQAIAIANDLEELSGSQDLDTGERQDPNVDWQRIALSMANPKIVFDGRNVVDAKKLKRLGIKVHMIGKRVANMPLSRQPRPSLSAQDF